MKESAIQHAELLRSLPDKGDYIRNQYGWNAHSHHIVVLFGINPGGHLPDAHMETTCQGFRLVLLSKLEAQALGLFHRIMCECRSCHRLIPYGRMHQHVNTKKCLEGQ